MALAKFFRPGLFMIKIYGPVVSLPRILHVGIEEFERQLVAVYGSTAIGVPNRVNLALRNSFLQFGDLVLGFWTFRTPAKVKFPACEIAALYCR